jgi:TolB-like protein
MGLLSELKRRNVIRMAVLYTLSAWLVMQVAEVVIGLATLPEWTGQIVLIVLAIGLPIALVFSWLYELTPEGLSLEKDVERGQSITRLTGRRMDFIVIALLAAVVIVFAYDKWWVPAPAEASIAVLPFKNLSADPEQEYFADGIAEEILDVLARTPDLTVIASRSSFQFKGENLDIKEIGRTLGVALILEGSVRNENSTVRVVAQLIDAEAGTHLWSQSYDREFDDVLALQNELSKAVVSAVSEHLGLTSIREPRLPSVENPEAYAAYQRGTYSMRPATEAGWRRAIEQFEKAIDLEPGYAEAHAQLALTHLFLLENGDATAGFHLAAATRHAKPALTLEPDLAEGHYAMARIAALDCRFDEAIWHLEQAIRSNPNYARAHFTLGSYVGSFFQGDYAKGFALWKKGQELDPLLTVSYWNEINVLGGRRELDKALEQIDKLESISPARSAYQRGTVRAAIDGQWAELAIGALNALKIDSSENWLWRILSEHLAMLGLEAEARAIPVSLGIRPFQIMGKTKEAATIAESTANQNLNVGVPLYSVKSDLSVLGLALAASGDFENARPLLEEMWELSGHRVTFDGVFGRYHAAALIAIRRQADEEDATDELIAAMYDDVRRLRIAGWIGIFFTRTYQEGLAAYLDRQQQMGLELIAEAVEGGTYILPNETYLKELYEDPGFAPIRKIQEERQARERERFLAITCNENPWAEIWQPREETCEQFYAAAGQ